MVHRPCHPEWNSRQCFSVGDGVEGSPGFSAVLVLILVPVLFLPFQSEAAEVIHRYKSHIVIDASGELLVTETIEVTAEGNQIKRGIYRDFHLNRRTFLGGIAPAEPNIVSVMRDGESEAFIACSCFLLRRAGRILLLAALS